MLLCEFFELTKNCSECFFIGVVWCHGHEAIYVKAIEIFEFFQCGWEAFIERAEKRLKQATRLKKRKPRTVRSRNVR